MKINSTFPFYRDRRLETNFPQVNNTVPGVSGVSLSLCMFSFTAVKWSREWKSWCSAGQNQLPLIQCKSSWSGHPVIRYWRKWAGESPLTVQPISLGSQSEVNRMDVKINNDQTHKTWLSTNYSLSVKPSLPSLEQPTRTKHLRLQRRIRSGLIGPIQLKQPNVTGTTFPERRRHGMSRTPRCWTDQ